MKISLTYLFHSLPTDHLMIQNIMGSDVIHWVTVV